MDADEGQAAASFPSQSLLKSLTHLTRESADLSQNEQKITKAVTSSYAETLNDVSGRLLGLCNDLIGLASTTQTSAGLAVKRPHRVAFDDIEDALDGFTKVEDVIDNLLELANTNLDEATGRSSEYAPNKLPNSPAGYEGSKGTFRGRKSRQTGSLKWNNGGNKSVNSKPQLKFEDRIDNSNDTPWPWPSKLIEKPNALKPWAPLAGINQEGIMSAAMAEHVKSLGVGTGPTIHPYEYEIQNIDYPDWMFDNKPEKIWTPFQDTDYTYVSTVDDLKKMTAVLEAASEIAVDTEHHDYRTYLGLVCLIQISTREQDFIVDTLGPLRSHLYLLNRSFTNPNIVKVFHGAESDVVWLQRDFGVYIVNLFDTFHASHVLDMPYHSFQYLLQFYCTVETDKTYQMADWRTRPLSPQMIKYARTDTHYLLYIWDRMRNELLTKSPIGTHQLLTAVLRRSEATSLQVFIKPYYDAESGEGSGGWRHALGKAGNQLMGGMTSEQFCVFKAIHAWRDHVARVEDESTRYVMPHHMLLALADRMPSEVSGLAGCCSPMPALVRMHSVKLVELIENARVEARQMAKSRIEESERIINEDALRRQQISLHIRFPTDENTKDESDDTTMDIMVPTPPTPLVSVTKSVPSSPASHKTLTGFGGVPRTVAMPMLAASSSLFGGVAASASDLLHTSSTISSSSSNSSVKGRSVNAAFAELTQKKSLTSVAAAKQSALF
ncbi:hypothetical protein SmJEL517_g01543 [Synchytrium microbalum]|uniref:HRDC domain-containing protein n=1 Tax=Synchytrium microbalum TaxID=1806994 RepID=A0A507CE79_9FUNG|nr:uncharacterized protein SmJEL517_g01543 [Synchytrium microbalum]TPX36234.1 hypothetical protein SmJEL517_g01543 [Synchytrium microbalum]